MSGPACVRTCLSQALASPCASLAAQAHGPAPSARQVDAWFWRQTVAGALLVALRSLAMGSENNALKTVGGRFFVPVPWLPAV